MKDNIKANKQHDGFDAQWQCRQQWEKQAEKTVPDDKTFLHWAEKAQQDPAGMETNVIPFHRTKRWIPYAAASIVIGVAAIGLARQGQPKDELPVAVEVTVENQTVHFLCNNDCSAQDIILSAKKVIK